MKRVGVTSGVVIALVLAGATISGAASHSRAGVRLFQAADRVCTNLIRSRNAHSYPPDRQWVWAIAKGCVFTRDLLRPADCTPDPDIGCASPPDVHVRYQRRDYIFHLTLRGVPAKAKGIWTAGGTRRLLITHDGRSPKVRQRLFIDFGAQEFDGLLQSGLNQGQPDLGPLLHWSIVYTLDEEKGLCCPRSDPGSPNVSPFDITPQRLTIATG
jgi:hypothetical protein